MHGNTTRFLSLLLTLLVTVFSAYGKSKLNVVTATEDLAALAREAGGDRIAVEAIARGYQD
ncbi:MAG: hypothetical protein LLG20_25900, partial [Acidobacteriales bacterium]|nr:hypothetical protein [Terriglobales bacterium]